MSLNIASYYKYFKPIKGQGRGSNNLLNTYREEYIIYMSGTNFIFTPENSELKISYDKAISQLSPYPYKVVKLAGRRNHVDYKYSFMDDNNEIIKEMNIEFKFNADSIYNIPQFVSLGNPSQYCHLSQGSFEELFYKELIDILEKFDLPIPILGTYLKQVHDDEPECMIEAKQLYKQNEQFKKEINKLTQNNITCFIKSTELNIEALNKKMMDSQSDKIYMFCKNGEFTTYNSNIDDCLIESYIKLDTRYRYIATTKSNQKLEMLLRWKNTNGIGKPAFQIKHIKPK
jgi:hypothetical protein